MVNSRMGEGFLLHSKYSIQILVKAPSLKILA
jgi:hypothetical protein